MVLRRTSVMAEIVALAILSGSYNDGWLARRMAFNVAACVKLKSAGNKSTMAILSNVSVCVAMAISHIGIESNVGNIIQWLMQWPALQLA